MTTARVTITLPVELREAAQEAAERAGLPFSTVISQALAAWMRGQLVDAWLVEHQERHGRFSEEELQALAEEAGVPYVPLSRSRSAA